MSTTTPPGACAHGQSALYLRRSGERYCHLCYLEDRVAELEGQQQRLIELLGTRLLSPEGEPAAPEARAKEKLMTWLAERLANAVRDEETEQSRLLIHECNLFEWAAEEAAGQVPFPRQAEILALTQHQVAESQEHLALLAAAQRLTRRLLAYLQTIEDVEPDAAPAPPARLMPL